MSDRVAFIGGSTSGRDHFPFPVEAIGTETGGFYTGVGSGRFHPNIISLNEACRWCWVVKKWHLGLSFDYSVGYGDGSLAGSATLSFDYQHKWTPNSENDNPPDNVVPTRESDLVRARWGALDPDLMVLSLYFDNTSLITSDNGDFDITNISSSVSNNDSSGEILLNVSLGHEVFSSRFNSWASGLVPKLFLQLSTTEDTATTGFLETAWYSTTAFPNTQSALTLDSGLGVVINTLMKSTGSGLGAPHFREISSIVAMITAVDFWPYKLRNGDPVWDTSDGSLLNDPLIDYDTGDIEEKITGKPDGVTPSTLVISRNPSPWIAV